MHWSNGVHTRGFQRGLFHSQTGTVKGVQKLCLDRILDCELFRAGSLPHYVSVQRLVQQAADLGQDPCSAWCSGAADLS